MPTLEDEAIQVAHQQTRFHLAENDQSKEIDIKDLDIVVKIDRQHLVPSSAASKGKASRRLDTIEIFSHAHLRIKTGVHYCLIGRNGAGKTTILRAIDRRLIPGLDPLRLSIATLTQKNDLFEEDLDDSYPRTVLDTVVHGDPNRNDVQRQIHALASAANTSTLHLVLTYRALQLEQAEQQLIMIEKLAKLRSGAHGYDARAELRKQEGVVELLSKQLADMSVSSLHETVQDEHTILRKAFSTNDTSCGQPSDSTTLPIQAQLEVDAKLAAQMLADLQEHIDAIPAGDIENQARKILRGLGFSDGMLQSQVRNLSGGWQMRCHLAAVLVRSADIMILDEPTNHLDLLGVLWLQKHILQLKNDHPDRSVIIVSHDKDFVNAITEELILIQDKKLVYYKGNVDSYDKSIQQDKLRMTRMKEAQDRQVAHIKSSIANNVRQGKKNNDDGKLKQARCRQRKLDERIGLEVSAKGTRFKLNRDLAGYYLTARAAIELPHEEPGISMSFPQPTALSPGSLVSLENVSLHYEGGKPIINNVNMVVHPGDRIGILGLNGVGKSTLIRLLTNDLQPSSGMIQRHPRLKIGYYSQLEVDVLAARGRQDLSLTALSHIMQTLSDEQSARALLGSLGLQGRLASDTPIFRLSGGQLVRLALALMLLDPPHLFVLDEPTTHLDIYTVTALAKALHEYDGAIVLVSHDRYLIRAVVEEEFDDEDVERRRIVYEIKDGKVRICEGGVDAWEVSLSRKLSKLGLL